MSGEGQGAERGRDGQGRRCDGAQVNPGNMPMVTSSAIARSDDTEERCYNHPHPQPNPVCAATLASESPALLWVAHLLHSLYFVFTEIFQIVNSIVV